MAEKSPVRCIIAGRLSDEEAEDLKKQVLESLQNPDHSILADYPLHVMEVEEPKQTYHVFFESVPIGAYFTRKGERYIKTGEEAGKQLLSGEGQVFEGHWGVVIDEPLCGARLQCTDACTSKSKMLTNLQGHVTEEKMEELRKKLHAERG